MGTCQGRLTPPPVEGRKPFGSQSKPTTFQPTFMALIALLVLILFGVAPLFTLPSARPRTYLAYFAYFAYFA
jgi:hypothetical protein